MVDTAVVDEIVLWLVETFDVEEVAVVRDEPGVVALEVRINATTRGSAPSASG